MSASPPSTAVYTATGFTVTGRRRMMITPEGIVLPVTVASRGARVAALLLDFFFLFVGLFVIIMTLAWLFDGVMNEVVEAADESVTGAGEFLLIVLVIILFLARYGYFLAFELGPRGATPGKRIMGIRVAAHDGGRLTAEAVIARNLLRDIELFLPLIFLMVAPSGAMGAAGFAGMAWFVVFMAIPFFNRDALRAGDIIAGTWIVEAPRTKLAKVLSSEPGAQGQSELTGTRYEFSDDELSVYGEHELQTLERVLRENNKDAMAAVHEAICRKIGWQPGAGDERAFLAAFYSQLRARLEGGMRFGRRKKDKFS